VGILKTPFCFSGYSTLRLHPGDQLVSETINADINEGLDTETVVAVPLAFVQPHFGFTHLVPVRRFDALMADVAYHGVYRVVGTRGFSHFLYVFILPLLVFWFHSVYARRRTDH